MPCEVSSESEHQLAGEERECVRRALHRSVPEFLGLPTERDKDAALNMACVRVLPRGQTLLREGERAAHVCAVLGAPPPPTQGLGAPAANQPSVVRGATRKHSGVWPGHRHPGTTMIESLTWPGLTSGLV